MAKFAVVLKDHAAWGPFSTRKEADDFCAFVTAEIDPAEVYTLSSPAAELLLWRKHVEELRRHG